MIEGHCKLKKVFSSRSCVPVEMDVPVDFKTETLPVQLDYAAGVKHINQLLSPEIVEKFVNQASNSIEESMVITGLS